MQIVVTDRRFSNPEWEATDRYFHPEPYKEVVESHGAKLVYGDFETISEIAEGCRNADIIITYRAPIPRKVIEQAEDLSLIICNAAGYDIVDIKAANDHGVRVSALRGYVNEELSEHTIALMLAAARNVTYANRMIREAEEWGYRGPILSLEGGTFGIVGVGEIGRAVIPKAQGLGMEVIGSDPYLSDSEFNALGIERVGFEELLERADCVSIHCQLTAETRGMFSTPEFQLMKDTAILVNTARGPIVDEAALAEAVSNGTIWNAALDVFSKEPPKDTPALSSEKIICSPHHGGITVSGQQHNKAMELIRAELSRALDGRQLELVVNPEAVKYQGELYNPELENWI